MFRGFRIDGESLLALRFAKIDICKGRTIDQKIKVERGKFLPGLLRIREIKLRMIESNDIEFFPILAHERRAETAASAQDYDFHRSVTAGALEQRLPPRLIVDVPLNRCFQAFLETLARFPFQLFPGK